MVTRLIARCFAGVVLFASPGLANAACYSPQQQLPAQTVSGFLGNPSQLLSQFPNGGAQMISQVRDLVASDPGALQAIMGLLGSASKDQQSAIGSGLGQAARICSTRDQAFATQIQQAVTGSGNKDVSDAYAAVTPNVPIGSAGGAGGGGGGGGTGTGGPTGGTTAGAGGALATGFSNNGASNSFGTFTSSGIGAISGGGGTTTRTTAGTSVSQF